MPEPLQERDTRPGNTAETQLSHWSRQFAAHKTCEHHHRANLHFFHGRFAMLFHCLDGNLKSFTNLTVRLAAEYHFYHAALAARQAVEIQLTIRKLWGQIVHGQTYPPFWASQTLFSSRLRAFRQRCFCETTPCCFVAAFSCRS